MDIVNDVCVIIFNNLPITDKRNFIRTCKKYFGQLSDLTRRAINEFHDMICEIGYVHQHAERGTLSSLCDYTIELLYDGYGHLIPSKYIIKENDVLYFFKNIYLCSAVKAHLSVMKVLMNCNKKFTSEFCKGAAFGGHLDILKWARLNGCEWDAETCAYAARNGHFEVLKWAKQNGCEWDSYTCSDAAWKGHFEMLKWARENGCEWNRQTCLTAAFHGHLEILKWAKQNGCEWDESTCLYAVCNGHLEILKWAKENGYDWNKSECLNNAIRYNHSELIDWINKN